MKRIICILLGTSIALLAFIAIKNSNDQKNREYEACEYRISRFDEFVQDGKVISLADVFPFEWDCVQIMNTPGFSKFDEEEIYAFAEKKNMAVSLAERFYLIVFRDEEQIIGLIPYSPGRGGATFLPAPGGPSFVEDGAFKEQWMLTVTKENAFFLCTKVGDYDGDYSPSTAYLLEYVDKVKE